MRDHILIIDDDEQFVKQISHYLIDAGYNITSFGGENDLKQLMDKVFQLSPDLILSDIVMKPDGFDFLKAVKRDSRMRMIPFIFVTAVESDTNMIKAYTGGADNFIMKPIRYEELLAKVSGVLNRQKELSKAMYLERPRTLVTLFI